MIWDITPARDDWERTYARMEWLRMGIKGVGAKRIDVRYEDDSLKAFNQFMRMDMQKSLDILTIKRNRTYDRNTI